VVDEEPDAGEPPGGDAKAVTESARDEMITTM
jgi:hypothetical protein